MTNQEVKDYLDRGKAISKEIEILTERRARLWQDINNVVPTYEANETQFMQNIRGKENKQAQYADMFAQIDERIAELRVLDQENVYMINKLDDSVFRCILLLRHVERISWRKITNKMNISEKTTFRYYGEALASMAIILENLKDDSS
jgi:hypothetical protein